jgi:hypothetical protein
MSGFGSTPSLGADFGMSIALNRRVAIPFRTGFVGRAKLAGVDKDLAALFTRIRRRWYPETLPVLVSYWLKTVYSRGHDLAWWKKLDRRLKQALLEQFPNGDSSRPVLGELQAWIEGTILHGEAPPQPPEQKEPKKEPVRVKLDPEWVAPYVGRLLNEWLPVEVARLLVDEGDSPMWQGEGIPVLATARALERMLLRERLSPATLELLLQPGLFAPQLVYPADAEILSDVVLSLLGRVEAPTLPVMPATLLSVSPRAPLPANFGEAVRYARLVARAWGEEVQVPLAGTDVRQILREDHLQIGSILLTMDGRWWEPQRLDYGVNDSVLYRPIGRLRIDYSADHARLRVPWPETRLRWSGPVSFPQTMDLFGREWRVSRWEEDAQRTWLHLEFFRAVPAMARPAPRYAA